MVIGTGFAVVGHRGWPTRFPDNTLTGLIAASTVSDAVEIDIRRSADGKLVLSHDPEIGGMVVAEHPWSVLGEVDLGEGHRPALLDEGLSALPGFPVMLEVKNLPGEPGFEPDHRMGLEAAYRARPGDMLTCFYWPTVDAVHHQFPDLTTGLLVDSDGSLADAVAHCHEVGHALLSVHWSLLLAEGAPEVVAGSGLEVYVWTVDEPDLALELARRGARAIITNDPGLIADARRTR